MTTHNEEIAEGWQQLHPLAVAVAAVNSLRQAIIPAIAVSFGSQSMGAGGHVILPIIAAIAGLSVLGAWLAWRRTRYLVGPGDIRVEKGLLSRSARSVPYERIQDVSLEQSLLPRLFGLVEVRFETGAGGTDELKLAYVDAAEGERLRDVVREQRDGAPATAASAVASPEPEGDTLFAMSPARLLLLGLFEFSLLVFAVVAGLTQQFEFLLPFDPWDSDQWEQQLAGPGAWLAGLGSEARIVGALVAVAVLVLLGFATGVVRAVLRDWNFRLDLTPRGFRRRRGLITRTDVVMPVNRVQAVIVSTGLVRRLWGWRGLAFVSLAQDAGSANHDVAPLAHEAEIAPIVAAAGFALPDEAAQWHRPSTRYRIDLALSAAVPVSLVGLVMLVFSPIVWAGPLLLLLGALAAARQYILWRFERYAIDTRQILSQRGLLAPRLVMASRIKLHSVEIAQGPLARRRGYASLRFGLAGGALSFDGTPLADAQAMREAVLASIASVDFSALPR